VPRSAPDSDRVSERDFVRRLFIVVVVGTLAAAVWILSDILLLLFAAVLFAVMLHALAAPLQAHLHLGRNLSLLLSVASIVLVLTAVRWPRLFGQIFRFDKWIVCRG
jgi:predicted PurR-regulated permease PerM